MSSKIQHVMVVCVEPPEDVRSLSGIPFHVLRAIRKRVQRVTSFGPGPARYTPMDAMDLLLRAWHNRHPKRYPLRWTAAAQRSSARQLRQRLCEDLPDAILAVGNGCLGFLKDVEVPRFQFTDAAWPTVHGLYAPFDPSFHEMLPGVVQSIKQRQLSGLRQFEGCFYGSLWAAQQAIGNFPAELHRKFHVAPLGANSVPDCTTEELHAHVARRVASLGAGSLELLFIGKEWERKGGPLAVEVARALHRRGQRVQLHVVGCSPSLAEEDRAFLTVHGTLFNDVPQQAALLRKLFEESHFLLVPTCVELFGIVFAEAQAFAMPPISRSICAIPEIIVDGETGLVLPADAGAEAYAERILQSIANVDAYRNMALRGRQRYETKLNWDASVNFMLERMEEKL